LNDAVKASFGKGFGNESVEFIRREQNMSGKPCRLIGQALSILRN
jgi:hypothetical protein